MKLTVNYDGPALAIPRAAALCAADATPRDWRLLFAAVSGTAPETLGLSDDELIASVRFWSERGVLECPDLSAIAERVENGTSISETDSKGAGARGSDGSAATARVAVTDDRAHCSAADVERFVSKNADARAYFDACMRAAGKIFNDAELRALVALREYYGFDSRSVILMFRYLSGALALEAQSGDQKDGDKPAPPPKRVSVRAVERLACDCADNGVRAYPELEKWLVSLERARTIEGRVRSIFAPDRPLSKREKEIIARWSAYGFGEEMLSLAYEKTVAATGKSSFAYADRILTRWNEENIRTPADVARDDSARRAAAEQARPDGAKQPASEGSFDTQDFFEEALRRSYAEN